MSASYLLIGLGPENKNKYPKKKIATPFEKNTLTCAYKRKLAYFFYSKGVAKLSKEKKSCFSSRFSPLKYIVHTKKNPANLLDLFCSFLFALVCEILPSDKFPTVFIIPIGINCPGSLGKPCKACRVAYIPVLCRLPASTAVKKNDCGKKFFLHCEKFYYF